MEAPNLFNDTNVTKAYDAARPDPPDAFMKILIDYYKEQDLPPISNVLDVGCGPGNSTKIVHKHLPNAKIVGTDISQSQIELAKKKYASYPLMTFMEGSANDGLPGADGSVQLITCVLSIHWLNLPAFFTHCHRVLSPGGVIAALCHHRYTVQLDTGPKSVGDKLAHKFTEIWSKSAFCSKNWKRIHEAKLQPINLNVNEEYYSTLPLPYNNKREWKNQPEMLVESKLTIPQLADLINSWGGLQLYIKENPETTIKSDFMQLLQTTMKENDIMPEAKILSLSVQYLIGGERSCPGQVPVPPLYHMAPDGKAKKWNEYPAMGNVIEGTRFICFKAPLDRALPSNPDHGAFTSEQLVQEHMTSRGRTLGLVVDLTDTYKFYPPYEAFEARGVKYFKLYCPGIANIPGPVWVNEFNDTVTNFLKSTYGLPDANGEEGLVGVHCLNGVNRTGFMVCQFMIRLLEIPAAKAIRIFEEARGCKIDSTEVFQALSTLKPLPAPKKK